MVGIIHDRVLDIVSQDRLPDVVGLFFRIELRRVNADYHDFIGIGVFQFLEFWQDVHAVDAAIGPEIQQDKFAPQVAQLDWTGGVQPLFAAFQ